MKARTLFTTLGFVVAAAAVQAKLPPPSDEAKAKAAEAAAKTAHAGKVDAYKLCLSMDRVAKSYLEQAKKEGKATNAPTATAPCADPGAFVYPPPVVASGTAPGAAPSAAPAAVAAATPPKAAVAAVAAPAAPAAPAVPATPAAKK